MGFDERKLIRKPGTKDVPVLTSTQYGEIPIFKYPLLEQTGLVIHGFTTKEGGVSKDCFSSMNLCFTRGDRDEDVLKNHQIMAAAMGYDLNRAVHSHQTHTTNVMYVDESYAGNGIVKPQRLSDVDGMITDVPGLVLMTFYADCTPLYFLDPVHKAIGLSHSGWKGTVHRMGKETVLAMQERFGTRPKDLLCCIGPSICQDCYEVSEDVANAFIEEFEDARERGIVADGATSGKYQLDLWKANQIVLLETGVLPNHIETTNVCTKCNSELLYSHRVMGNARGNLTAILSLKNQ